MFTPYRPLVVFIVILLSRQEVLWVRPPQKCTHCPSQTTNWCHAECHPSLIHVFIFEFSISNLVDQANRNSHHCTASGSTIRVHLYAAPHQLQAIWSRVCCSGDGRRFIACGVFVCVCVSAYCAQMYHPKMRSASGAPFWCLYRCFDCFCERASVGGRWLCSKLIW